MTYDELDSIVDGAWSLFFDQLGFHGLNTEAIYEAMNRKDCFNDVMDAIVSKVELQSE